MHVEALLAAVETEPALCTEHPFLVCSIAATPHLHPATVKILLRGMNVETFAAAIHEPTRIVEGPALIGSAGAVPDLDACAVGGHIRRMNVETLAGSDLELDRGRLRIGRHGDHRR